MQLIGRDAPRRRLKDVIADGDIGLVIVRGPSGAGKTALVDAVLLDIVAQGFIVGRGKFADDGLGNGFVPILQALTQVVSKALDLLYDPAAGAESLRKALGGQLSPLESAGFGPLDVLVSPVRAAIPTALTGREGAARIIDGISRLMRWLHGFGTPIVLFVDDWQRAPQEAHAFAAMAIHNQSSQCTVILAERREALAAPTLKPIHADVIDIGPLDPVDQIALLGAAIGNRGAAIAIAAWLGESASGLPFDLIEAAQALVERSAVVQKDGAWVLDTARAASIDRQDFTATVVRRARMLPRDVLEIGVAFALWGDRTPLARVADALDRLPDDIVRAVQRLECEGIVRTIDVEVSFVHDRLRAALLAATDDSAYRAIAAAMAARLLDAPDAHSLMRAALRFRLAAGLENAAPAVWRDRFANEAMVARNAADSAAADAFAEAAWALRERQLGGDSAADRLILREASLAAAARRELPIVRNRVKEMIGRASTLDQLGEAYEVGIVAASLAGDRELAWSWSIEGLSHLGARPRIKVGKIDLLLATIRWRLSFVLPSRAPPKNSTAETIDALSRITRLALVIAYGRDPLLALMMGLNITARAQRHGYRSTYWLSRNILYFAATGHPERASRIAEAMAQEATSPTFARAATLYLILYFGLVWTRPLATLRDGCDEIYEMAIAEGDLVFAAVATRNAAQIAWRTEATLAGVAAALVDAEDKAERIRDSGASKGIRTFAEVIRILRDPNGFKEDRNSAPWMSAALSPGAEAPIVWIEILGMRSEWAGIAAIAKRFATGRHSLNSHPGGVIWRFHENLARLKLGLSPNLRDLRYVRRAARLNPTDHQRKLLVLEAELLRRKGRATACLKAYANAVEVAAAGSSRLEAGIAAECAASAARGFGEAQLAERYDTVARTTWNAWGAFAKTGGSVGLAIEDPSPVQAQLAEAEFKAAVALRSERAKSRFLAEVGHELRTPLQGMQSLLDLAAEAPSEVSLDELREVFGSFKTVVDDLTDLAALGGGAPLNLKPTDIVDLVESEARIASVMAMRKALSLVRDIPESPCIVKSDGARVRQVVRNLLSNAVKYTDRGEVKLRLIVSPGAQGSFDRISIVVEDSGPGLREQDLLHLFEPFERGERDDADGLGLGLALSRRIAERMGGTLTAGNCPRGGASFTFAFEVEKTSEEQRAAVPVTPLRILLVEDVPLNRRMIATMLRRAGHNVLEAADGAEALARSGDATFDLLLLDVGLPDIDGFRILEAVKQSPRNSATAVIVLTASTSGATTERALGLGATRVLHKPISSGDLSAAIQLAFSWQAEHDPRLSGAFDAELEDLTRQAHVEILARGQAILLGQGGLACEPVDAHRLAGLAAQFGASAVAAAADRLEAELIAKAETPSGFTMLAAALSDFTREHFPEREAATVR